MTTLLSDITAVDWSPKLGMPGDVVANATDINQCIRVILETPRGSRPHQPLFGSDIYRYVDAPYQEAIPRIVQAVTEAIELWEPRIRLIRIVPIQNEAASGKITLRIEWSYKESTIMEQTEVIL
ncbi:MAG: GPW/gp25 family protein [Desulfobulbus sp.]